MFYLLLVVLTLVAGFSLRARSAYVRKRNDIEEPDVMPSGSVAARRMLNGTGVEQVAIRNTVQLKLASYNLDTQSVYLPSDVYSKHTVTASAIATHECGHAVQHAQGSRLLVLRSSISRVARAAAVSWMLVLAFGLLTDLTPFRVAGLALYILALGLQVAMLPLELDASRRALAFLASGGAGTGLAESQRLKAASSVLRACALSYLTTTLLGIVEPPLRFASYYVRWD